MQHAFCTIHCALCNMHCAPYTVHYTTRAVHCKLRTKPHAMCGMHFAMCAIHHALCTIQYATCSSQCVHCITFIIHCALFLPDRWHRRLVVEKIGKIVAERELQVPRLKRLPLTSPTLHFPAASLKMGAPVVIGIQDYAPVLAGFMSIVSLARILSSWMDGGVYRVEGVEWAGLKVMLSRGRLSSQCLETCV